ncbi:acetyl-CoA carboxylase biotin carboxylase subunit [Proteiniclasticum sp. BAD-10]|uniref:Biotin carboxylase n=1 Tax=Proteiniclasticum sediminis TaxID=2804028 RepID=A0A941CQ18_9CLOT|nr:acetyl-CoA carboxylase biotin carboxylase subunit [Proteiniclasticum sediminis]MBR0575298.1 acetyl-CoA carboxylase biotin carboxylase subunit [Proteiniclasticum sediminis]
MKILIANRGEIALRVLRAAHELNIGTVAVYSMADKDALHVKLADEAYCIGKSFSRDSYLNMENILSVAVLAQVNYIHPGYGFLSESPLFRRLCRECNIGFIGPHERTMELMGDKVMAKEIAKKAGIPVVPGSDGEVATEEEALRIARTIGYPLLVKASSGGGGKGIRIVEREEELKGAFTASKNEALANFGSDGVYLEKYLKNPRHIEFQILRDEFGNAVHLGERDCSLQRRKQKVVEESPSPTLPADLRQRMGEAAVKCADASDYLGAGTVEFLLVSDGSFYFMEMNTRIQVEHPVTEMVTGVDLVKEQILIALGQELSMKDKPLELRGHALECRINAEDPANNFAPSPGNISFLHFPSGNGIRVDSACYSGADIVPFYDSMVAKIIVHGKDRAEAISKMKSALYELTIQGIKTNQEYQEEIISSDFFRDGDYHTLTLDHMRG